MKDSYQNKIDDLILKSEAMGSAVAFLLIISIALVVFIVLVFTSEQKILYLGLELVCIALYKLISMAYQEIKNEQESIRDLLLLADDLLRAKKENQNEIQSRR